MNNIFLDKQFNNAKDNYNYFLIKMIVKIFQIIFKMAILLLVNQFFDYLIINIISLIYVIYLIYNVYEVYDCYSYILNDIKNTIHEEICYEIDFNLVKNEFLKRETYYGK